MSRFLNTRSIAWWFRVFAFLLVVGSSGAAQTAKRRLPTSIAGDTLGELTEQVPGDMGTLYWKCRKWPSDFKEGSTFSAAQCVVTKSRQVAAIRASYSSDATRDTSFSALVLAYTRKYGPPVRESSDDRECLGGTEPWAAKMRCAVWEDSRVKMAVYDAKYGESWGIYGVTLMDKNLMADEATSETKKADQAAERILDRQ